MARRRNVESTGQRQAFFVKDCALVVLATGRKAFMLQQFRSILTQIEASSVYHHFWGGLLQPRFGEREYNNDFAAWVRHGIHDAILAERLAALDPTRFPDLEALRSEVIEQIDNRLDEAEQLLWAHATHQFEFVSSQIVVFDTERRIRQPAQLAEVITELPTSSIFYHFIDARRRTEDGRDDFSDWLAYRGESFTPLRESLAGIDPYFSSLGELRDDLAGLFAGYFRGRVP